jgi:hypothetical protein
MKKVSAITITFLLFFLLFSPAPAQVKNINELTVVVPAESIAKFIQPLLPYSINIGKNFSGFFRIILG